MQPTKTTRTYHFDRQLYELVDSSQQLKAVTVAAIAMLCQLFMGLTSYISLPILFIACLYCGHKGWNADFYFHKKQGQRVELTDQSIRVFNTITGYDVTRRRDEIFRCRHFDLLGFPLVIVAYSNHERHWFFCFNNSKQLYSELQAS